MNKKNLRPDMHRGEIRVWTKGFCVGICNEGGLNATRLAMEEEDRRQIGVKSILNGDNPGKLVSSFFVCQALPNVLCSNEVEKF